MASIRDRLDFTGRTVLVTGASGEAGIGAGIARAFYELGATVVNLDMAENPALLPERYRFIRCDITAEDSVRAATRAVLDGFGKLDVLVNNAGIIGKSLMESFDMELFDRIMAVNVTGTAMVTKHCIPLLRKSGAGSIINTASVQAYIGTPVYSAYSASKAAVCGLTRVWAKELVRENITVNAICPGFVHTDMFEKAVARLIAERGMSREEAFADIVKESPQKRPIMPSEIGDLAVFLGSGLARGITGQSIHLDGGIVMP